MTEPRPTDGRLARLRSIRLDLLVALALAAVLSTGWAIADWAQVGRLLLPDNDDMIRLAQVRDWLAGQGINDWTQYRMAPPLGAPMHWSRINDFGIAAIVLGLTPLLGRHHAELAAVLAYPALLFACALLLSARIGRRLWGPPAGPVAAILTALAFPGTTVFVPGRIDHHALQVVLIQALVLALMRAPAAAAGAAAGAAAALSLIVGLETAPQVVALVLVPCLLWTARGREERARLAGFAAALGGTTLLFLMLLRPNYWPAALCDAFTPASSTGMLAASAALALLAAATPLLGRWELRLGMGALLGGCALGGVLRAFPSCIGGPYGQVDPFLQRNFLAHIEEANGIFTLDDPFRAISIAGLLAAGCAASLWLGLREPRRWPVLLPLAAAILASALVTLAQVRGAYIGAPLAAPMLAGVVLAARARSSWRLPAVMGAWLACAGLTYLEAPRAVARMLAPRAAPPAPQTPQSICGSGNAWAQLDRLPPGVTMAPTSIASYLIGATHHSTVGAGYHRNNAGNMAMYRFFLSAPDRAREIGREWKVDYVAICPGDFGEIRVSSDFPDSLAARLKRGEVPPWLEPFPLRDTRLRLFKVR